LVMETIFSYKSQPARSLGRVKLLLRHHSIVILRFSIESVQCLLFHDAHWVIYDAYRISLRIDRNEQVGVLDRLAHRNHTLVQVECIAYKQDIRFTSSYMFTDVKCYLFFFT